MPKLPWIFLLLIALTLTACHTENDLLTGKSAPLQTARHFSVTQTRILSANYLLFLPTGYAAQTGKKWPLILFLHGAGERGSDVWLVAQHGPPKVAPQSTNFPFIVVSPQCPPDKIWSNDLLLALLDEVTTNYAVDTHRIYLTGLSMGGFGTWTLGLTFPERFAAIAPLCGGGDSLTPYLATGARKEALKTLPVWAFHGAKDPVVPPIESEHMVGLLKQLGDKDVKLTIYPDALHDCWTQTYANPELFEWFLKHSR
ncbi:MAG: prolyl oligopeptidase family serine peptidase [Verrucomicrobiota bacterium]|jgi:predicted peptidase